MTESIMLFPTSKKYVADSFDICFRTILVYVPSSGCFMTHLYSTSTKSSLPLYLPLSWLRLCRLSGKPAKNSFIKDIHHVWCLDTAALVRPSKLFNCYQWNDEEASAPLYAPTNFGNIVISDQLQARSAYRAALFSSCTFRKDARKYVRDSFHGITPATVCVIDQRETGDTVLQVVVRDSNGRPNTVTNLIISSISGCYELQQVLSQATIEFHKLPKSMKSNTRTQDKGSMVGVGLLVDHTRSKVNETKICNHDSPFRQTLKQLTVGFAHHLEAKYPGIVSSIRNQDSHGFVKPPHYLGGEKGFSCSMAISHNLVNATHYDVHDGSVGTGLWSQTGDDTSDNWHLVFPNILIKKGKQTFHGLAVQLFSGAMVVWDGRLLRHGSAQFQNHATNNHSKVGFWFGANSKYFQYQHSKLSSNL